ncbi:MAG: orotidine-5'-phosphate decarboxylase, partial [Candidatus Omnitrophica bacterium]|nr:orotidine-5'-phosphate decarboxylase [Candidatus Omnitrophota bacterium]
RELRGVVKTVKVGSALFTVCGPPVIQRLRALGFEVMLDLKFFDIPNTVALSCRAAARHRVSMVTVHARGGREMLEAAVRGSRQEARLRRMPPPRVLAVTILTSAGAGRSTIGDVLALARTAQAAGCDGVVASAHEARALRARFSRRLRIVCPGIRPRASARGDQRRVATPARALADGADWLVVGRPITAARSPQAAARSILREMAEGTAC